MAADAKQGLLEAGAKLIHRQGFNNTGIQEILREAGVPKGSFYFHFASKEAFGLELIDHYGRVMGQKVVEHLDQSGQPALTRLRAMFGSFGQFFVEQQFSLGCPVGNLCQEMSDLSPALRQKLEEILMRFTDRVAAVLEQAQASGEIAANLDPQTLASFLIAAWEGSLLLMKTAKTDEPLKIFEQVIFNHLIKPAGD